MKIKSFLLASLFLIGFYSCIDDKPNSSTPTVSNITFNPLTINLNVGEVITFTINVSPNTINLAVSDITLSSSVQDIVSFTVTSYKAGVYSVSLEGKNAGTTSLSASLKNSDKKATATVNVTKPNIPLKSINLFDKDLLMANGVTYQLSTNVTPKNASDTSITWSVDNDNATVSNTGLISANKVGTVKITATSNSDKTVSEVCNVTIYEAVKSIEVSATSLSVKLGSIGILTAKALPTTASYPSLYVSIEDATIATVINDGHIITITPIKEGITNIVITSSSNKSVSLKVPLSIVFEGITSLNIVEDQKTVNIQESFTLRTELLPADASDKTLTWSSEKPDIVSVVNGVITGVKSGSSKVYAVSNADNTKKDSCIVSVPGVILNKYTLNLDKGTRETLMATIFPTDFDNNPITYSSSNPEVASVDANTGEITAVAVGDADITASLPNTDDTKPPYTAICKVSVSIFLKSITITNPRVVLELYKTETLIPEFTPSDASDKSIKWTSSNDKVAFVENNGLVTGSNIGETDVKAISNFDNSITATAKVYVKGIILESKVLNLKVGNEETVTTEIYPSDLSDKTLNWESSAPDIVSVDASGKIKALKPGTATINISVASDHTIITTLEVNVAPSPYGINLSHSALVLNKRQNATITAEIVKAGITNMNVIWTSDNEAVASVDASGLVITHIAGYANIIATSVEDNTAKDTCKLNVNGINLDHKTLSIPKGKTSKITPQVLITKTTDLSVTYTTENAKVSVDANGLITAKDTGMVHIFVTSVHNSKLKDTVLVTVQGLQFSVPSLELKKGGSQTVTVTAYPSTLNGGITWSSENELLATVNSGTINGISYGETHIVATYTDIPEITDKLKVSVTGIELDHTTLSIPKGKTAILKHMGLTIKSTNQAVTYTSSDQAIASVDNNGLVTAHTQGEVTITISFVNDNSLTATCKVIVQTITFDITKLTLRKTETKQITATIYPSSLTGGVTWTSGDNNIASVSTTGLVTANNHGTTKITATSNDNPDLKLDIEVNVLGFTLNNKNISIYKREKSTLTPVFSPADFSNQSVTWTSKDVNIATVENGVVTGIDFGVTKIYAVSNYDNTLLDSCEVTVKGIKFNTKKVSIYNASIYGYKNYTFTINKYPSDLDVGTLIWKSDNTAKVSVNSSGFVQVVNNGGLARVSAVSSIDERITDTADVQVVGITFDKTSIFLLKENSANIKSIYFYVDGTISEKTTASFVSDDPTIASVTSNGLITAKNYGSTNINLAEQLIISYGPLGNTVAPFSATVKVYIPNITIDNNVLIFSNRVNKLPIKFIPSDLPDKTIIYETDNQNIITFNADGTFNRIGVGTANITARYKFNTSDEVSAITSLTLHEFYLNKNEITLIKNKSETLIPTVDLGNLSNSFTWSSSDDKIATVSQSGLVQAIGYGEAKIYITSNEYPDIYRDSCIVNIKRTTYISEFKFEMSKNHGMQNDLSLTNYNDVQYGGDFKYIANNKLVPTFTVPAGATVKVKDAPQTSGVSVVDFTSAVNYVVTSADGLESETFKVALNFINDTFNVSNLGEIICKTDPIFRNNVFTAILADSMNGYNLESIGTDGFNTATNLKFLSINNKITKIQNYAFNQCDNLSGDLYIPPNVINIGIAAFYYLTGINSIRYREGITIGALAFRGIDANKISTYTWP